MAGRRSRKPAPDSALSEASGEDLFGPPAAPAVAPPPEDSRHGHRDRLRQRFMAGGEGAVADYELLELVLFRAIPRRDVKPLAKRLLSRFGDFANVISAEPQRLREVDGVGEAAVIELKIVERAAQLLAQQRVLDRPVLSSWDALLDYCRAAMARQPVEQFRVLFLDKKNQLIADEVQARGTVDQAPVYPREVAKRALELGATALILAHNHPSGDPTPSRADIEVTRRVVEAAAAIGVIVHDHLIIGGERSESLRALGHI